MLIIAVVTYVYPWQEIVSGHVRTEVAFERTFGSHQIAQLILFGAFLSLLKIFNGNFVASTRMLYAIGRRNLVHPSLGRVHATFGTPVVAISLMAALTAAAAMFGDAILVPITEVGSLAVGVGWLSACVAYLLRRRDDPGAASESPVMAWFGCAVSSAIILMKVGAVGARQLHPAGVDRLRRLVGSGPGVLAAAAATSLNGVVLPRSTQRSQRQRGEKQCFLCVFLRVLCALRGSF